jgi:hypothetical protein
VASDPKVWRLDTLEEMVHDGVEEEIPEVPEPGSPEEKDVTVE